MPLHYNQKNEFKQLYLNWVKTTITSLFLLLGFNLSKITQRFQLKHSEVIGIILKDLESGFLKHTPGTRIDIRHRRAIEFLLYLGKSYKKIADILGFNKTTIYREIKRLPEGGYRADLAQRDYNKKNRHKDRPLKLTDPNVQRFIDFCLENLKEKKYSPESSYRDVLMGKGPDDIDPNNIITPPTFYRYYHLGLIEIDLEDFVDMAKRIHDEAQEVVFGKKSKHCNGPSIEERPKMTFDEFGDPEFGFWELDCVLGKQGSGAILTLVEKKTRFFIAKKLSSHSSFEVLSALEEIFAFYGELSQMIFKVITTDNGKEFSNLSWLDDFGDRIYYCHVAAPKEKALIERSNRILRRYVPKGSKISGYSDEDILLFTSRINGMSRKILGWKTAEDLFLLELSKLMYA